MYYFISLAINKVCKQSMYLILLQGKNKRGNLVKYSLFAHCNKKFVFAQFYTYFYKYEIIIQTLRNTTLLNYGKDIS